jgi:4-hydroxythreonine-4-phosphate dehydrogenase
MKKLFKIGITIGDVNGIGLEIFAKFLSSKEYRKISSNTQFKLFGNNEVVTNYFLNLKNGIELLENLNNLVRTEKLTIVEINTNTLIEFGKISINAGKLALDSITKGLEAYFKNEIDCLVTLPICKEAVQKTLYNFIGHTEFIASFFEGYEPLMTFVYNTFRICLLTTHMPLSSVSSAITKELLAHKIEIFYKSLRYDFGIPKPKVAVLGLNPHSGENGILGKEEIETFQPVLNEFSRKGYEIFGPFPSDGIFAFNSYKQFDGVIACYHDQGLIPFKIISKGKGVNFTANLPIVRTSPDHGTGFDKAGENVADYSSLKNSIFLAIDIFKSRKKL